MPTVSHSQSESNHPHTLRSLCIGIADSPADEMDAADRQRATLEAQAMLDHDTTHCQSCGLESSGNVLAGVRVPLCDGCLMHHAITTVGLPMAHSVVEEIDAADEESRKPGIRLHRVVAVRFHAAQA